MSRRSTRLSMPGDHKPHKRVASTSEPGFTADTKKQRTQKATPTKSKYFSEPGGESEQTEEENPSDTNESASDFEDEIDQSQASEVDEDDASDSDGPPVSKGRSASSKGTPKGSEIWRPGVKSGLGPGKQLIIKKPKARPAGSTPYKDETIHPNTLLFLADLKVNNNREWLKLHDAEFRQAEKDWHSFVEKLTERLVEDVDDTIPELPVKDVVFRIYRDIRFSSDPTPYKPFFSASWSRAGRKGSYAHYYIQVAPPNHGKSFIGGGLWHPDAGPTAAMRNDIDRHPKNLKDILNNSELRTEFLGGAKDSKKAVQAFVQENAGNALKTRPKGYSAEHPDIELLRLKNYTIGKKISNDEILGDAGMDRVVGLLKCLKPFITHCNSVVLPDDVDERDEGESQESDASDNADSQS
ncbi:uncharacterized protein RCC_10320 [Ramularia collo-cygni]|uniref:TIGR02453 family protein n=1 Tax=Ramularia collo-cygni TaxID=112498 RepID=A0A2D3VFD6_9PEZI|nr:uncharacterized protein RCC_10320 [Ramularia collo-cygni]CZT24595.1 uncharacterized protein RCC_10320 [Ramularia collo-cygni]